MVLGLPGETGKANSIRVAELEGGRLRKHIVGNVSNTGMHKYHCRKRFAEQL
jgi:hypothetical protein